MTELVFILDRSGSMSGLEEDTIGGFNSMLKKQKGEKGEAYVTTILFDSESEVIHDRLPIETVPLITEKEYFTRGSTALLDAVGDAVNHIKNIHKYVSKEDVPQKTLFVITTDGMENSSRRYDYEQVKNLIEQQKEVGWEFIFLGANIDAITEAEKIGISQMRAANYHCDSEGTKLNYEVLNNVVCSMRMGKEMDEDWSEKIEEDYKKRKRRFLKNSGVKCKKC